MEKLTIDFGKDLGAFKPVNGVTNGPGLHTGALDPSRFFGELDLPLVRLHDTELLSLRPFVDYCRVFPDIDRDENDPKNYRFAETDRLLEKLQTLGVQIIFRFGASATLKNVDNHAAFPCPVEKLSDIMLRIAEHYCGGWADGYRYENVSFEVWNEPDLPIFYSGEESEFHRFYGLTARKLRDALPGVKVGGCAFSDPLSGFARRWLDFVRESGCPLDFFSYHFYGTDAARFREKSRLVRELLDGHGFAGVPTVLDEWNFNINFNDRLNESYRNIGRISGACFTAAMLTELQKGPVDFATYYDMQSNYMMLLYNGLYYFNGFTLVRKKPFYAFLYFRRLKELGRVRETSVLPDLFTLAAFDGTCGRCLIANYSFEHPAARELALDVRGDFRTLRIRLTDRRSTDRTVYEGPVPETVSLPADSVVLMEFE